jgi:hypothetical protein
MSNELVAIMAQIAACQARVEGMKADNDFNKGVVSVSANDGDCFKREAQCLERLAIEALNVPQRP